MDNSMDSGEFANSNSPEGGAGAAGGTTELWPGWPRARRLRVVTDPDAELERVARLERMAARRAEATRKKATRNGQGQPAGAGRADWIASEGLKGKDKAEARTGDGWFRPGHDVIYDQDHAQAVLEHFVGDVRYVEDTGTWLVRHRKAGVWKDAVGSDVAVARRLLARAADRIPRVGSNPGEKKAWKDLSADELCWLARKRYRSGSGAGSIAGFMTACAGWQNSPWVVREAELDTDAGVLWTPEGPLWLGVGEREIDLDTPHRKVTAVVPRAGVATPYWDKLMSVVWPDAEIREWALDLLSVGLTGVAEKMFIYFYGPGDTAKTSVVELIVGLLGSYGVGDLDSSLVSVNAQPWERIKLKGARLGLIDEAMPPGRGPTETLKKLTGGAPQSGADKGKKPVTFTSTHTLAFTANPEPGLTDPAVTSRGRLVPCMGDVEQIRAARAGLAEAGVWEEEGPGVLWDLVVRARRYLADRSRISAFRAPLDLQMQVADLVGEQDALAEWLDDCTRVDREREGKAGLSLAESRTTRELYDEFARWCALNKRTAHYLAMDKTLSWFGGRLGERYGRDKPMKRRGARGVVWQIRIMREVRNGVIIDVV